jgi:molybdopterin-containing oxidoreductase family iron-sulfur binding subunit
MSMDRRQFLKLVGMGTAAGVAGAALTGRIQGMDVEAYHVEETPEALKARHWAMVVDMKKFQTHEDIRKCIDACHKVHNVPDWGNPKDEIKWIWTDTYEHVFPGTRHPYMAPEFEEMPFLTLCNHCEKPPCVRACPTKATFKRKQDGIVMMDYHRCIGCRFCMAACPYGARSFNWRDPRHLIKEIDTEYPARTKGVVEKCTFCVERLARGLKPACVEASAGALVFGDLEDPESEVRRVLASTFTIRRKPELGTAPSVYYVIGGGEHA